MLNLKIFLGAETRPPNWGGATAPLARPHPSLGAPAHKRFGAYWSQKVQLW